MTAIETMIICASEVLEREKGRSKRGGARTDNEVEVRSQKREKSYGEQFGRDHSPACITTFFISFVLEFEALNDLSPQ